MLQLQLSELLFCRKIEAIGLSLSLMLWTANDKLHHKSLQFSNSVKLVGQIHPATFSCLIRSNRCREVHLENIPVSKPSGFITFQKEIKHQYPLSQSRVQWKCQKNLAMTMFGLLESVISL